MKIYFSIVILALFILISSCSSKAKKVIGEDVIGKNSESQSFEKIAPLTSSAITGRKNLYDKGWYFIPSTKKTFEEVSKDGKMSALTARAMIFVSLKKRAEDYPGKLGDRMKGILTIGQGYENSMNKLSKDIYSGTFDLVKLELNSSKELFSQSGDKLIQGYATLIPTSKKDTEEIYNQMKNFNGSMNENYKKLDDMFGDTAKKSGQKISGAWKDSYSKALKEFEDQYNESGERPNSLLAVWDIFQGYTFALKEFAISPLAETGKSSGTYLANNAALTSGYVFNATGQGIVSTGMVIFTPVKLGYRVLSPSLESGFLATLGMGTAISTAPTALGGISIGAFNQVTAVSATSTVRGVAATGSTIYETTTTGAGMVYDIGKGSGTTVLYGLKSGVVLGYSALTALPAHLILAVPDGTIFLAWDGPRLVVARFKGNYKGSDALPTGAIIDLEEAKKDGKVEIITDDEKIIKKVLEKEIEEREEQSKSLEEKGEKQNEK